MPGLPTSFFQKYAVLYTSMGEKEGLFISFCVLFLYGSGTKDKDDWNQGVSSSVLTAFS